jgi:hypothetical protein
MDAEPSKSFRCLDRHGSRPLGPPRPGAAAQSTESWLRGLTTTYTERGSA